MELNIDNPDTVIVPFSSPNSNFYVERQFVSPIRVIVYAKSSPLCLPSAVDDSIFLAENTRDVGTQTSESSTDPASNPLVAHGLVSRELFDLLTPPEAKIPVGQKRPLRIQSKARVLTASDVQEDLIRQEEEIEAKRARREERMTKRSAPTRQNRRVTRTNANARPAVDLPAGNTSSTAEHLVTPKCTATRSQQNNSRNKQRRTAAINEEDDFCYLCNSNYDEATRAEQLKWVGCETEDCPHWVCTQCLPPGFNYNSDYFCEYCS